MTETRAEQQTICKECLLDNTVGDIWYNEEGKCKYCLIHDELELKHPLGDIGLKNMEAAVEQIKKAGKGKEFDCIVGVSGGRDSSYTLLRMSKTRWRDLESRYIRL